MDLCHQGSDCCMIVIIGILDSQWRKPTRTNSGSKRVSKVHGSETGHEALATCINCQVGSPLCLISIFQRGRNGRKKGSRDWWNTYTLEPFFSFALKRYCV